MKIPSLIYALLFVTSSVALAQNTVPKGGFSEAESLVVNKTTAKEVIVAFGEPSNRRITPVKEQLQFNTSDYTLLAEFNQSKTLSSASFKDKNASSGTVSYSKLKKISSASTRDEIKMTFGKPSEISLFTHEETWVYNEHKDGKDTKSRIRMMISFEGGLLKKFIYSEMNMTARQINPEETEFLMKGHTASQEIESKWGLPSSRELSLDGESWRYSSPQSNIYISFDHNGVLSDFIYETKKK